MVAGEGPLAGYLVKVFVQGKRVSLPTAVGPSEGVELAHCQTGALVVSAGGAVGEQGCDVLGEGCGGEQRELVLNVWYPTQRQRDNVLRGGRGGRHRRTQCLDH